MVTDVGQELGRGGPAVRRADEGFICFHEPMVMPLTPCEEAEHGVGIVCSSATVHRRDPLPLPAKGTAPSEVEENTGYPSQQVLVVPHRGD
jgi:hypothetical protein